MNEELRLRVETAELNLRLKLAQIRLLKATQEKYRLLHERGIIPNARWD